MDVSKYSVGYYPPQNITYDWVKKDHIEKAPHWCIVDLRDGNQSLVIPMSPEEKLEFYKLLLKVGFKEIEVGFPAASETEYEFLRTLIDDNMIPDDVTVQVLTQCREHIIRKTFDACKGAPNAIIHFYNSVSVAQREQVFRKSKDEIKKIAIDGARLVKKLAAEYDGNLRFEYSPESFTGAEPEYALEVCNAVLDVLEPSPENNVIINLPVTVEMSLPHVYASQVEFMDKNLRYRENVTISLLPHNDRGTGVADVIRVNSQSGKGGIGYLLEQTYGYDLPAKSTPAMWLLYVTKDQKAVPVCVRCSIPPQLLWVWGSAQALPLSQTADSAVPKELCSIEQPTTAVTTYACIIRYA